MKHIIFTTILVSLVSSQSFAGLLFFYNRLAQKDYEEMNTLIHDKISESKSVGGDKSIPLKEALQAVLCRPNNDSLISKVLPNLKIELDGLSAWDRTIKSLVKESIGALKNPRAFKPEVQVTYTVFLENLISELKVNARGQLEQKVLEDIKDANIVPSNEAKKESLKRMKVEITSPSIVAELAIKEAEASITHISAGGVSGPGAIRTPSGEVESGK